MDSSHELARKILTLPDVSPTLRVGDTASSFIEVQAIGVEHRRVRKFSGGYDEVIITGAEVDPQTQAYVDGLGSRGVTVSWPEDSSEVRVSPMHTPGLGFDRPAPSENEYALIKQSVIQAVLRRLGPYKFAKNDRSELGEAVVGSAAVQRLLGKVHDLERELAEARKTLSLTTADLRRVREENEELSDSVSLQRHTLEREREQARQAAREYTEASSREAETGWRYRVQREKLREELARIAYIDDVSPVSDEDLISAVERRIDDQAANQVDQTERTRTLRAALARIADVHADAYTDGDLITAATEAHQRGQDALADASRDDD